MRLPGSFSNHPSSSAVRCPASHRAQPIDREKTMTPEERISQLEQELAEVKQHTAESREVLLEMAGATRAFECAVLAMLSAAKQSEAVGREIRRHLERLDSELVFQSMSEAQIEGAQRASEVLIAALEESQAQPSPALPVVDPESVATPSEQGDWVH